MRFVLGMAQMAGTTTAGVLLFRTGVSTPSLLAVVVTCAMTTLSVLLFGSTPHQSVRRGLHRHSSR